MDLKTGLYAFEKCWCSFRFSKAYSWLHNLYCLPNIIGVTDQEEGDGQTMWETGQMRTGIWSGDLMGPIGRSRRRGRGGEIKLK